MQQKFIARIGVKAWNDLSDFFQELPLSKTNQRSIEISSKEDDNGLFWTTKVAAKLKSDSLLLHEPCIIKVRLLDCYYIIGTADTPCRPTIKDSDLIDFSIEYQSKNRPQAIKKVLSITPDCE